MSFSRCPAPLLFLLLLCVASNVQARQQDLRIERFVEFDGLANNQVVAITQDSQGFMWFATFDGLSKYDGYHFTTYRHDPEDPSTLSGSRIESLYSDSQGRLWVGTWNGLNRYDPETNTFVRYPIARDEATEIEVVIAMTEDRSGILWIGTHSGLFRLDPSTETVTRFAHDPDDERSLSHNHVRTVYLDKEETLWIGTGSPWESLPGEGGLNRFDPATEAFTRFMHDPDDDRSLSNNWVRVLFEDQNGVFWVGTWGDGLQQFDPKTGVFTHLSQDHQKPDALTTPRLQLSAPSVEFILSDPGFGLTFIAQTRDGHLWLGAIEGGVLRYDPAMETVTQYEHDPTQTNSLSANSIWAFYEDRQGTLWIATWNGLNKVTRLKTTFQLQTHDPDDGASLIHNNVLAIFESADSMLWVGTSQGLSRQDPVTGAYTHFKYHPNDRSSLSHPRVNAIYEDASGVVWVGTANGLNALDPKTGRITQYLHDADDPASLGAGEVESLFEDRQGTLWIGLQGGGLNRFDRQSKTFRHYRHRTNEYTGEKREGVFWENRVDFVRAIYEDHQGHLWLCTYGGLIGFDPQSDPPLFTQYSYEPTNPKSISDNRIWSIHEDPSGTLWIGASQGLNAFDRATESFVRYAESEGLPDSRVYGIVDDEQGKLWMSTPRGIARFDPETKRFLVFDVRNDLYGNVPNNKAMAKSRAGEIFVGGTGGLTRFYPETLEGLSPAPPIALTSIRISNPSVEDDRPHPTAGVLELTHEENVFSFEFAVMDFADPEKNRYAYRLENYRDAWRDLGTRHEVTFMNLDPGEYRFTVKGSNHRGVWNEAGVSVRVVIHPPFWATWWFRAGILLTVTLLLYGVFQVRTQNIRKHNRALQAEISEREQVEEQLRFQKTLLESQSEASVDGILMVSEEGRWMAHNQRFIEMWEIPPDIVEAQSRAASLSLVQHKVVDPAQFLAKIEHLHEHKEEESSDEIALNDGRVFDRYSAPVKSAEGEHYGRVWYFRDITERKQAEVAIRESQERLQLALGASRAGTFVFDVATQDCTRDDRSLEIFGLSEADRCIDTAFFYSLVHPEDVPLLEAVYEQVVLASESHYRVDYRIRRPDGDECYVQANGVILRNDQGEAVRVIGVEFDITDSKQAESEREQLIEDLEVKNAELERFTYTVSHDLKSPLVTIKGFLGLLQQDAAQGNTQRLESDIAHISNATDKMSRLLGELLELSRIGRLMNPPEAVSLSDLADEAVAMVAGQIAERGVDVAVTPEMPVVHGDRVRLVEVFQNLIDNAVKFIGDQERPRVEIRATRQNGEILCSVRDNGIGIEARFHEKVFGLFDRLDAKSEGTGIGLALVKRIVEVHGGRIWVESEGEGRGSTFWFTLPEDGASMPPAT